jgi:hypothetical protein
VPELRLDAVVLALRAAVNPETGLPFADSLIWAPIRLAPWRQDVTLSLLFFASGVEGRRSLEVEAYAHFGGRELAHIQHRFEREDGSHHWVEFPISFSATEPGRYALSGTITFEGATPLRWDRTSTSNARDRGRDRG